MYDPSDEIWQRLDPIINKGEHITAIKLYREEKKAPLPDAKKIVEARIEDLVRDLKEKRDVARNEDPDGR